ncbi:FtsH protease activity modulator HflK [Nitrococcus mobilis]|uniref:Protein HflK n=1 Tax=Nitrococcus mobilis Nb-231 TaxID=314278 RepID=A4BLP6_9GAMM|nr:FtsH protease activity modulator HflK [Nitrococcus mobilis]EAR23234.1 hflK protein [Nitrococcus mobilis Nb-231]
MSWNDPGSGNRDPWGGRRDDQGPPDLDELVRKLKERFKQLFRRGNDRGDGGDGGGAPRRGGGGVIGIAIILAIGATIWLLSGFYIVDQGWRGLVTRFGKYTATTLPGPHWHLPYPIEQVSQVNAEQRRRLTIGYGVIGPGRARPVLSEALMLTEDENIVNVQLAVQYHVSDPAKYVFNFSDADQTLKDVTESALREVIGKHDMDFVLTRGRAEVAAETQSMIESIIDRYELGLEVVTVAIQDIRPPEQVQSAFSDVNKAREDEQRLINQAQSYRNAVLPKAQGEAARISEQAAGYRAEAIARAEGDTSRFSQIASEYAKAPEITRERLYLETMEGVFSSVGKVVVSDTKGGQPFMYLPLDRMLERARSQQQSKVGTRAPAAKAAPAAPSAAKDNEAAASQQSNRSRSREVR